MTRMERLGTDFTTWEIGPYHNALPSPMKLRLELDGEIIVSCAYETGFLHRGLEKSFEKHDWVSSIAYADRLDPECAVFAELALCLAVEELAGIEVPARAQRIRVILSELARIASHMGFTVRVAKAVGAETMVHYVLRDREKVLDLFELLTGARFSLNFLRFGGVHADVTEGFIERVLEFHKLIRVRLKEYNDLFTYNHTLLQRTSRVGVMKREVARELGITGPNARACGLSMDVRKTHPYCGYQSLDFAVPGTQEAEGDSHARLLLRLREILQSADLLRTAAESMPTGAHLAEGASKSIPVGEAYSRVESSRGLLGCHVVSEGTEKPARIHFRVPSLGHLSALPGLAIGAGLEDLPLILASLDIGVSEVDR